MSKKIKDLPGVFALTKRLVVSDGVFTATTDNGSRQPVFVFKTGLRGTQNLNPMASDKDEVGNVQETHVAKLPNDTKNYTVTFSLGALPLTDVISACAQKPDEKHIDGNDMRHAINTFMTSNDFEQLVLEIGCRFARNIANGRWLWRNRAEANSVKISVAVFGSGQSKGSENSIEVEFYALSMPFSDFENYSEDEIKIGKALANGFLGIERFKILVSATIVPSVNGRIGVYPSENYLAHKPKGFARSLYYIPGIIPEGAGSEICLGQAALRSEKIANALRTFDTWYPEFSSIGKPLAIEANGASLDHDRFFRKTSGKNKDLSNSKASAFTLFSRLVSEPETLTKEEKLFLVSILIRGGVFPGVKKEKRNKKTEEDEENESST